MTRDILNGFRLRFSVTLLDSCKMIAQAMDREKAITF